MSGQQPKRNFDPQSSGRAGGHTPQSRMVQVNNAVSNHPEIVKPSNRGSSWRRGSVVKEELTTPLETVEPWPSR